MYDLPRSPKAKATGLSVEITGAMASFFSLASSLKTQKLNKRKKALMKGEFPASLFCSHIQAIRHTECYVFIEENP